MSDLGQSKTAWNWSFFLRNLASGCVWKKIWKDMWVILENFIPPSRPLQTKAIGDDILESPLCPFLCVHGEIKLLNPFHNFLLKKKKTSESYFLSKVGYQFPFTTAGKNHIRFWLWFLLPYSNKIAEIAISINSFESLLLIIVSLKFLHIIVIKEDQKDFHQIVKLMNPGSSLHVYQYLIDEIWKLHTFCRKYWESVRLLQDNQS